MVVSKDNSLALTVSADHLVGRYDLTVRQAFSQLGLTLDCQHPCPLLHQNAPKQCSSQESVGMAYRTKHPGNAAIALRDDGKVCAVGGWDGK
jgi:ASTRA-associated protein 1